jgi:hypothetical protein
MRATDGYFASNINATPAPFILTGGEYGIDLHATWNAGSVTLEKLAGDGSTYLAVLPAFTADSYATVYLPHGQYKLVIATATGVYVQIKRIPGE